jgi:phenylalanyl-tRNA synthetase beta chain
MNIQILDSWLRQYLKTKATPKDLARELSLTSVAIERIEKQGSDFIYDIEVTTNRPDLMSVVGIAQEAAAVLPQAGIQAEFVPPKIEKLKENSEKPLIEIHNDKSLINRICAAVLEVKIEKSPKVIQDRLEASGIRSLNNVIDVTNYVMREMGHPSHVFDLDRLNSKNLTIRLSKKGEKITTLDEKTYTLPGGDIVAEDDNGQIVDLIGVMGLETSVVTENTKRILFFIDNNNPHLIRKTSMNTGIRTEAAILNEKNVDPELAYETLLRGIDLFKEIAHGDLIGPVIDIYPNKTSVKPVSVSLEKINQVIGIAINPQESVRILRSLDFLVEEKGETITVMPPTARAKDITLPEDIIEEVARVYGYSKIPSVLPPLQGNQPYNPLSTPFYWEERVKEALKYWGMTEVYTYSMVSENLLEVAPENAVTIANPLNEDLVYMRTTLVPSLLEVVKENKTSDQMQIFEVSKVYHKKNKALPDEKIMLAAVFKGQTIFMQVKGLLEQLLSDLEIQDVRLSNKKSGRETTQIFIGTELLGEIEMLEENLINFELDFELMTQQATRAKVYKGLAKFPPIIEDVSMIVDQTITYEKIINTIKEQSSLIVNVSLLDSFKDKKTFRITYQNSEKNLTTGDVVPVREKIQEALTKKLHAKIV